MIRGGLVVPPGDARQMADAILELYHNSERRLRMGQLGRLYVEQNYSRSEWASRLEALLRNLDLTTSNSAMLNGTGEKVTSA